MRRRVWLGLIAVPLAGGAIVGIAALAGAFDDADEAREVATRYAAALTAGSSESLAAVSCTDPSKREAAAFEARAGGNAMRWRVLHGPEVRDDTARGTLRVFDGDLHRDYPFSLEKRDGTWCAHFNWTRLGRGG